MLTQLKNVPVRARASKFGKSGHSEGNDVGKAKGMCRKKGIDLQRCIRGARKHSKGPRACIAKKIQFWSGGTT